MLSAAFTKAAISTGLYSKAFKQNMCPHDASWKATVELQVSLFMLCRTLFIRMHQWINPHTGSSTEDNNGAQTGHLKVYTWHLKSWWGRNVKTHTIRHYLFYYISIVLFIFSHDYTQIKCSMTFLTVPFVRLFLNQASCSVSSPSGWNGKGLVFVRESKPYWQRRCCCLQLCVTVCHYLKAVSFWVLVLEIKSGPEFDF